MISVADNIEISLQVNMLLFANLLGSAVGGRRGMHPLQLCVYCWRDWAEEDEIAVIGEVRKLRLLVEDSSSGSKT